VTCPIFAEEINPKNPAFRRLALATREPQTFQRAMQLQDIQGTHLVPGNWCFQWVKYGEMAKKVLYNCWLRWLLDVDSSKFGNLEVQGSRTS